MEHYYIVTSKSDLHRQYWNRQTFEDNMRRVYNIFARQYRIESTDFIPDVNNLIIKPTINDRKRFADQFKINEPMKFSMRKKVGSAWSLLLHQNHLDENVPEPDVIKEFGLEYGRCKYRIFNIGNRVFCTMDCERDIEPPDGFQEISSTEFFGIMKDNNVTLE